MKNKKIIPGIIIAVIVIALSIFLGGQFSILGGESDNYVTKDNIDIHFNVNPRILDDSDHDINSKGFLYNEEYVFDYFGKELKITGYNQLNFENKIFRGDYYRVVYGGEVDYLYSKSFEEMFDTRGRYYETKLVNQGGIWTERVRDREISNSLGATITDTVRTDIDFKSEVSFNDGQLKVLAPNPNTCPDKEPGSVDYNYCILSDIVVEFNPDIELLDFSLDKLIDGESNVANLQIDNKFDDFNGIVRVKIELENTLGMTETNFEDLELIIKSGVNDYEMPIASFILVAKSVEVEVYSKQLQTNVRTGYVSTAGTIRLTDSIYNTKLQETVCQYKQELDSDDDTPQCYQDLFVKKLLATYNNDDVANILVNLQASLRQKISLVSELSGNLEEQASKINELSNVLEEKIEIVAQLDLSISEQSELISILTTKVNEQVAYISKLKLNIEDQVKMISLLTDKIESQALMMSELTDNVNEQALMIKELTSNSEKQGLLILELTDNIQEQADMIKILTEKSEKQSIFIVSLTSEVEKQATLINTLTQNLETKVFFIEQLQSENELQAKLIKEMKDSFSNQGYILSGLEKTISEDIETISLLSSSLEEQGLIMAGMQLNIDEQVQIIKGLTIKIDEQGIIMAGMQLNIDEQVQIIKELTNKFEEQGIIIANMQLNIDEQIQIIKGLSDKIEEQALIISQMESNINDQIEIINGLTSKIEEQKILIAELNLDLNKEKDLVYGLVADLERANEIIEELQKDKDSINTNNAVLVGIVILLLVSVIYFVIRRKRK